MINSQIFLNVIQNIIPHATLFELYINRNIKHGLSESLPQRSTLSGHADLAEGAAAAARANKADAIMRLLKSIMCRQLTPI